MGLRDPDDFDEFYRVSVTRLTRFVYAYTADASATQDLVQETYARAWRHWDRLRGYDNPEAWLRTVAGRLAASRWRRLGRYGAAVARLGPGRPSPPPADDVVLLVTALRRLSSPVRTVVVLHHLLDRPVSAVAAELDLPLSTVKTRLARGRAQLAQLLGAPSTAGNNPAPDVATGAATPEKPGATSGRGGSNAR